MASDVVRLQSPKFAAIVATLRERWAQDMPRILFTDERVNDMLVTLESSIMPENDRLFTWKPAEISWSAEKNDVLPVPILGLEYTLSLYAIDRSIRFAAVTSLDLRNWSLTGSP